ncbi:MAG: helix-turn-helix transcriptional regulator [Bacteroidales bacterium]|nr:helix-turn-helix transcriptional regulator [Bacteroidales bacterium]
MNKRLLQFLSAENISQSQLADTLGVARAGISHILAGRNKPGYDFIESLMLHYPDLNIEWLITGKGRMYNGPRADESPENSPSIEPNTLDNTSKSIENKKGISKIIVYYTDGTFVELQ